MKLKLLLLGLLSINCVAQAELFYRCQFESRSDTEQVLNGVRGACPAGSFGTGVSGNALHVTPRSSVASFRLPSGALGPKGRIDFWAKLDRTTTWYSVLGDPNFFSIVDDRGQRVGHFEFTANNGSGSSGLYASLPGGISCVSGRGNRFATFLGSGTEFDWHRYAIAWNADGISSLENTPVMAIFVDGSAVATMAKSAFSSTGFAESMGQALTMHFCYHDTTRGVSSFWLDDLTIWNTDAADGSQIQASTYTIHFDGNSEWAVNLPNDILSISPYKPSIPAGPTRVGWTFDGWTNSVNDHVYQTGDVFNESCEKDEVFTLYAKWVPATVENLAYTDEDGTVWSYDRSGDRITVKGVEPGPSATSLVLPEQINGATEVVLQSDLILPEKFGGLWWDFQIITDQAYVTRYRGTVPSNLVLPSKLGGRDVAGFLEPNQFCHQNELVSVEVPGSFVDLDRQHFNFCSNLERVVLHEGVRFVSGSFRGNPKLKEIELPSTFATWQDADSFDLSGSADRGLEADGFRYADRTHRYILALDSTRSGAVQIPEGVVWCSRGAFQQNTAMTSCRIPDSLPLTANMFLRSSLTAVDLPGAVERIGACACGTMTITHAYVRGVPPTWDLKDYFPGLKTVSYAADLGAEWSDYLAAHPAIEGIKIPVSRTVTFDPQGGTLEETAREVPYGEALGELPAITWTDHEFCGWFSAAAGGERITTDTIVTNDVTFHAQWRTATNNETPTNTVALQLFETVTAGGVNSKGATYSGFIGDDALAGMFTLVVKRANNGNAVVTMMRTDSQTGRKVKVSGSVDLNTGICAGALTGLVLGTNGLTGTLDGQLVQGTIDATKTKDASTLSVVKSFNRAAYSLVLTNQTGTSCMLTATFSTKGKVRVSGTFGERKIAGTTTVMVGDCCAVPFVYAKNGIDVTFVMWFDKATKSVLGVTGLRDGFSLVAAGSTTAPEIGDFVLTLTADDLLEVVPGVISETPLQTALTWNGRTFDAGRAAKVSYRNGTVSIDRSRGENVSRLTLKCTRGALSGSFTVYAVTDGRLVANKFTLLGCVIDGVGYVTARNRRLGTLAVEISRE